LHSKWCDVIRFSSHNKRVIKSFVKHVPKTKERCDA
jgi:hypothetical protein